MAYARAFDDAGNTRGYIPIIGKLDESGQRFHARLIDLRNKALAHHGMAGINIPWSGDYAVLHQHGNFWKPVAASRRSLFDRSFGLQLKHHLSEARNIVDARCLDKRSSMMNLLSDAIADPSTSDMLCRCELSDPDAVAVVVRLR